MAINDTFIINQLNWKYSLRDYCAANVRKAFGIQKGLGNADAWGRYCDKTVHEAFAGCVAWFRPGNRAISTSPAGHKYGHVGVILNITGGIATVYDGPNGYCFKVSIDKIDGIISPKKMVSLGSNVILIPEGEKQLLPENNVENGEHPADKSVEPVAEVKAPEQPETEPVAEVKAPSVEEALAEVDEVVSVEFAKQEAEIADKEKEAEKPAAATKGGKKSK